MVSNKFHSDLAIPPGEYLEEVLNELGLTKDELARRMGRPAAKLSPIFKGKKTITPETALQLERVVGVPAHVWLGLEIEYRLTLARMENGIGGEALEAEGMLVKRFQYSALVKAGLVEKLAKTADRVQALRMYFGVMSLLNVTRTARYQAAFRYGESTIGERTPEAVAAWLRMGEIMAHKVNCAPFDANKLRDALNEIRAMTLQKPEEFMDRLREKLAECGVALVVCEHFPKTKAHGAVFWISRDKAVLMLTIRFRWADIFWFSFFHEIGHILLHGRQSVVLEDYGESENEKQANKFASDILIPRDIYKLFVSREQFFKDHIIAFAEKVGIDKGIIVGRLQHEKLIEPSWHNDLRKKYEWSEQ